MNKEAGKYRIEQLSIMLSSILKIPKSDCEKIILSTPTGCLINENNEVFLYEQQTANLWDIKEDLEKMTSRITEESIASSISSIS